MKNTVTSYANLKPEVKKAFKEWLEDMDPDSISFPFKGQNTKGYLFKHEDDNYLVAMYATTTAQVLSSDDDDDDDVDADLGAEADLVDDIEADEEEVMDEEVIEEEDDEDMD